MKQRQSDSFLELIQYAQTSRHEVNALGMDHFVTTDFSR